MKKAETASGTRTRRFFWLYLLLDVLMAAAVLGLFYLFLKILPQSLQYEKLQEAAGSLGLLTGAADNPADQAADVLFGDTGSESYGNSGQPAEIEPTETPVNAGAAKAVSFREKFPEFFTAQILAERDSYSSPGVSVRISMVKDEEHGSLPFNAYIADVHTVSVKNLQAGFPAGHRTAPAAQIALDNDAVLGVNGDFYLNINKGLIVRNGTLLQSEEGTADICVLYPDGVMKTYGPGEYSVEGILNQNPWQVWSFGPALLDEDGLPKADYNTSAAIYNKNPRTAIGYYEPGHYCLVVVDGRSEGISNGASIRALAAMMSDLGCKAAYNLDGGASSAMIFNEKIMNQPSGGGRKISDMVMICELPALPG